jgi:hypothetical protein
MKNLIVALAVCVVLVVVVGWCLNWYQVIDLSSTGGGHRLQIDVNTSKIKADLQKSKERIGETIQDFRDDSEDAVEKGSEVVKDFKKN